jgi:RNA polymerase sigma-70 factor (ECF subfamily)
MTTAAAGREGVYLRMLREHDLAIRRLAASYERDPARRQDLVQDIWMAVWQALPSFRGDCSERTFLFRIGHNRGVSHIKHWRVRRTEPLMEIDPIDPGATDPEQIATDRERRARLLSAVLRLPLGLRQATVLMLEGMSQREIAEVLGITENNAAVRLSRARAAIAKDLADLNQESAS